MIKNRAFAVNIFLPQVVEHENADFMNGFRNFRRVIFKKFIPSTYSQWEVTKLRVFFKNFFSLIPSGRSHLSRCFWKNLQKFCCCAGIRLLPLHLLHVWKPFCEPLKKISSPNPRLEAVLSTYHRKFLLQSLTATFGAEKRHHFWKNLYLFAAALKIGISTPDL